MNSRLFIFISLSVFSFLLSALLTPLIRNLIKRFGLLDHPNKHRNVHKTPVPRVGGIAVFVSFLLPLILLYLMPTEIVWLERLKHTEFILLFVLGAFIFLLGLVDDIWNLPASLKLIVQIIAAGAFAVFAAKITTVNNPLMSSLVQLGWLSLPATVFWIVGITNAFNLIDGVDGLATGSAALTALTMICIAVTTGNYELVAVLCALAGAVLGFLKYNFNPATIFLGDCGSLFIGFTIGAASILGTQKNATLLALAVPLFACGLPLLEATLSVVRRFLSGKPIFGADRGHIHHQLLAKGYSQRQTVLMLYGVSTVFALLGLFVGNSSVKTSVVVLLAFGVVVWLLVRRLGYEEMEELAQLPQKFLSQRQVIANNLGIRQELKDLSDVETLDQLLEKLENCFQILRPALVEISFPAGSLSHRRIESESFSVAVEGNRLIVRWTSEKGRNLNGLISPTLSVPFDCGSELGNCLITFSDKHDAGNFAFDFYLLSRFLPEQLGKTLTRLNNH